MVKTRTLLIGHLCINLKKTASGLQPCARPFEDIVGNALPDRSPWHVAQDLLLQSHTGLLTPAVRMLCSAGLRLKGPISVGFRDGAASSLESPPSPKKQKSESSRTNPAASPEALFGSLFW